MKKWNHLFNEDTSAEHDQNVLRMAQHQLQRNSKNIQTDRFNIFEFLNQFSKLQSGALASGLIAFGVAIYWKKQKNDNGNLELSLFNSNFTDLVENPEDVEVLSDIDFEILENLDLLEDLPEDV
jgi:hypothetical protein